MTNYIEATIYLVDTSVGSSVNFTIIPDFTTYFTDTVIAAILHDAGSEISSRSLSIVIPVSFGTTLNSN